MGTTYGLNNIGQVIKNGVVMSKGDILLELQFAELNRAIRDNQPDFMNGPEIHVVETTTIDVKYLTDIENKLSKIENLIEVMMYELNIKRDLIKKDSGNG